MNNLCQLTLSEAISGLKAKEFSRAELVKETAERIDKIDKKLHAFISVNNEAINEAEIKDNLNENLPFSGIPFAVKDVLSTKDIKTTASSQILRNYFPIYDATVVKKLKDAGAIVVGKTNSDAFAFGASTENSGYGPTKNPWDIEKVPGGSSGGSAAAVSADECIFSLGTDTGGSIRQPSSFCNISGLKPTYGACSRFGLLAMASSFDCPGPMGKTVEDIKLIFDFMKGKDPLDATSHAFTSTKDAKVKDKIKIGLPKEFFSEGIDEEVKKIVIQATKVLQKDNIEFLEIPLPNTQFATSVYYILVPSEISSNMARYDGIRFGEERETFEDEVKRRIMIGTYSLSAGYYDQYYLKAAKARSLIKSDYEKAFEKVDLIMGPVYPVPPFKFGEKADDPIKMYLCDILTVSANLAGIPGLAIPCGFTKSSLPVGMQILGPRFSEELLFSIGEKYQKITDWHKRRPPLW